jgi:hypothetical protein
VVIRRSFRLVLRLGLLAGIAFTLYKLMQARRIIEPATVSAPDTDPWPPVAAPVPTPAPPPPPPPPPPVEAPVKKATAPKKPAPPKKAAKKAAKGTKKAGAPPRAWIAAQGDACPLSHPIKAKMSSRIYHLPGMVAYSRTHPDRCYATESAAKRDGFTAAKR